MAIPSNRTGSDKSKAPSPTRNWVVFAVFTLALGRFLLNPPQSLDSRSRNFKYYISLELIGHFPPPTDEINHFGRGADETFRSLRGDCPVRLKPVSYIRPMYVGTDYNISSDPDSPQSFTLLMEIQGFCRGCEKGKLFNDTSDHRRFLATNSSDVPHPPNECKPLSSQDFINALNANQLRPHTDEFNNILAAVGVREFELKNFSANYLFCSPNDDFRYLELDAIQAYNELALEMCEPQARYLSAAAANIISIIDSKEWCHDEVPVWLHLKGEYINCTECHCPKEAISGIVSENKYYERLRALRTNSSGLPTPSPSFALRATSSSGPTTSPSPQNSPRNGETETDPTPSPTAEAPTEMEPAPSPSPTTKATSEMEPAPSPTKEAPTEMEFTPNQNLPSKLPHGDKSPPPSIFTTPPSQSLPTPTTQQNPTIQDGEECGKGGANNDGSSCSTCCLNAECGDGVVQDGEECDEGADNKDGGSCSSSCQKSFCGDGIVQGGEECDEGRDNDDGGSCTTSCKRSFCGDGIVQGGEECDEGRDNDDGGSCTLSSSTRGEGKTAARDSRLSKLMLISVASYMCYATRKIPNNLSHSTRRF